MGRITTVANIGKGFMKLTKDMKAGLSKAKNAPARTYAKNPKGKAPTPAKGLPDKGMMGAKEPPKLNSGAQAAKDLKDKKVAVKTERVSKQTEHRKAVDYGVASRAEAAGDVKKVTQQKRRARGYERSRRPNKTSGVTTAQKVVGGTTVAIGGTAAIMINDKKSMPKAKAKSPRGGAPMAGIKGRQAPASSVSRGGSRAVNKPAPAPAPMRSFGTPTKTSSKGFTIPATPVKKQASAPAVQVKDLSSPISLSSAPLSTAKKPDKQVGGLFGRTDGKWHLRRKAGKG